MRLLFCSCPKPLSSFRQGSAFRRENCMEKTKAAGNSGEPKKENKMGVMPIPKLLISMSLPMIISMIV